MSMVGREHVQVGMHLEILRKADVRFIAVSNDIDSLYPETLEFAPFLNIMNEWYARDISRKIKLQNAQTDAMKNTLQALHPMATARAKRKKADGK